MLIKSTLEIFLCKYLYYYLNLLNVWEKDFNFSMDVNLSLVVQSKFYYDRISYNGRIELHEGMNDIAKMFRV